MPKLRLVSLLTILLACLLTAQAPRTSEAAQSAAPHVAGLPPAAEQAMASVDPEKIRAQVKFLASDLLEGRGTGGAEAISPPSTLPHSLRCTD